MPTSRLLAVGTIAAWLALATLAIAQTRVRHRPKPSAMAPDSAAEASQPGPTASASAPPAAAPSGPEPGVVPPPPSDLGPDGGRHSPLTPAPNEFSDAAAPAPADYDKLLADIAALRARVAAVSDTLFHSRISVSVETTGSQVRMASLAVSLDDGIVWTAPESFRADQPTIVYDHAVAPGHHAVAVEAERRDDRSDVFRSTQRSRFIVDVPSDDRLSVALKLSDDSNMGSEFPSSKSGVYALTVRMEAKALPAGK